MTVVGLVGGYFFSVVLQGATPGLYLNDLTLLVGLSDFIAAEAKAAAQKQISTKATISGAGVVKATGSRVTVLVFLTQTTMAPGAEPSISASRVEVKMQRVGNGWKVAGLTPR